MPFLPRPTVERRADGTFFLDFDRPESIGRLRTFLGNFGMFVRALSYIAAYGNRIGEVARDAVLNANYIRAGLAGVYHLKYDAPSLHEVVFSDKKPDRARRLEHGHRQAADGLRLPSADRLLPADRARGADDRAHRDRGQAGLDAFIHAMREIARECEEDPEIVRKAPHTTPVKRVDEVGAARNLILRWRP